MKKYILFHSFENDELINAIGENDMATLMGGLLSFGQTYGFSGNLWELYLTFKLICDENAYSLSCEGKGNTSLSLKAAAMQDFEIIGKLYEANIENAIICDFDYEGGSTHHLSHFIRNEIVNLSKSISEAANVESFYDALTEFYKNYGVGDYGLHKAFRLTDGKLVPVTGVSRVVFDDLVGNDLQKKALRDNTEAFLSGKAANNCLLYGDAGTGKSTSIKALMNEYFQQGLRVIEIYKHDFSMLNSVIASIKHRDYKFILFMDDLSFEDFEIEYKYLKAVIEGGLEKRPSNVLIYATSNRRHLIKESFKDKGEILDDDLHKNDTVQEKLSLSNRFGVQVYFPSPAMKEFERIVLELARRENIADDEQTILEKARQYELRTGGLSGRTARQFIDFYLGRSNA